MCNPHLFFRSHPHQRHDLTIYPSVNTPVFPRLAVFHCHRMKTHTLHLPVSHTKQSPCSVSVCLSHSSGRHTCTHITSLFRTQNQHTSHHSSGLRTNTHHISLQDAEPTHITSLFRNTHIHT